MSPKKETGRNEVRKRKEEILKVAVKVFAKSGYHKALMDDIAKKSGFGKATLYRLFGSKRRLFLSLFKTSINSLEEEISLKIKKIPSSLDRLKEATKVYLGFFEKNRPLFKILSSYFHSFDRELDRMVERRYLPYIERIRREIERGIKLGEIKRIEDTEGFAYSLLGVCNSLIYRWLIKNERRDLTSEFKIVEKVFFKAIENEDTKIEDR